MRILLISHQLDYSGAPIALLQLARALLAQGHAVFLVGLQRGPLAAEFAAAGVKPAGARKDAFDLYVANTSVSVPAALTEAPATERVLAWIHESDWFFRVLDVTPEELGLHALRYAAFPSQFQIDEFRARIPGATLMQLRNCVPMDDASPSPEPGRYIVCAGTWEVRKGNARLLQLLQAVDPDARIVFVGATRPPGVPNGPHLFTGQVPPAEAHAIIATSYGVISAAEAETQNLVAIEAIEARRPVLLSDIPAHRELRDLIPGVLLFDARDPASFARGYAQFRSQWDDAQARERMSADAVRVFGREAFDANVRGVLARISGALH